MEDFIKETAYIDYRSKEIQAIIAPFVKENLSKKELAKRIYLKVRDSYRYFPYRVGLKDEHYKASLITKQTRGNCIEKSIIYIACMRALGIPARLRLARVKNHIGIEKFEEKFQTSEITPHGMAEIYLNDKWLKASPAFNKELCDYCNVASLDFDGENDSIFQEFDKNGGKFMEYLEDYGYFADVPKDFIVENVFSNYPHLHSFIGKDEILVD